MGQEIKTSHFRHSDFDAFNQCLEQETRLLQQWFDEHQFDQTQRVAGYELEAWLTNDNFEPSPSNQRFLEMAQSDLLSPELAQFNIELNTQPRQLSNTLLSDFETDYRRHWLFCQTIAKNIGCRLLSIGTLPTLEQHHLTLDNISRMTRYRALNEQVLRQHECEAFELKISGRESISSTFQHVMLEAASTSLQIHLQVPQPDAVRYYNASILLSAPLVAVAANSPFLLGKDLWAETRIPVFEQAVNVGGFQGAAHGPVRRVSFGTGYARESLMECFDENLQHFPILLPMQFGSEPSDMKHLGLHNGTIWRWNRPLIGFNDSGQPHLRIEQRVCASGPSIADNIANIALFYGLVHYYAQTDTDFESIIEFPQARDNFYTAAQHGITQRIQWPGCERCSIRHLILNRLLDEAESGLNDLGISHSDTEHYLSIIEARVERQQTGSDWQRQFVQLHGHDLKRLTHSYYQNQQTHEPVHRWDYTSAT